MIFSKLVIFQSVSFISEATSAISASICIYKQMFICTLYIPFSLETSIVANGVIAWFLPTAAYLLSPSVATVSKNVLLQTINIGLGTLSQMGLDTLSQIGMGTLSQIGLGIL